MPVIALLVCPGCGTRLEATDTSEPGARPRCSRGETVSPVSTETPRAIPVASLAPLDQSGKYALAIPLDSPQAPADPQTAPSGRWPDWGAVRQSARRLLGGARVRGKQLLAEARQTAVASGTQTARLACCAVAWVRCRLRERWDRQARLALGRRLFEQGLGDEGLRGQIAVVGERPRQAQAANGPMAVLPERRQDLELRLAEAYLADGPGLPPVEAERREAVAARAALEEQRELYAAAHSALRSAGRTCWLRVGAGYTAVTALLLGLMLLSRGPSRPPAAPEEVASLIPPAGDDAARPPSPGTHASDPSRRAPSPVPDLGRESPPPAAEPPDPDPSWR